MVLHEPSEYEDGVKFHDDQDKCMCQFFKGGWLWKPAAVIDGF